MEISGNQVKFLNITAKLSVNYDELKKEIQKNELSNQENDIYFKLTPQALTEYAEGKEQYVIIDMENKVYSRPEDVSETKKEVNHPRYIETSEQKELEQLKTLLHDKKSLNDFM